VPADLFEIEHGGPGKRGRYANPAPPVTPMPRRPEPPSRPAKAANAKAAIARIQAAIRAIPPGRVAGYGVVARRAGLPGRARLVARILSGNDDPTLPWHRVLRSDGRIAFPPDSGSYAEQVQRLRAEGVTVEAGRVRDVARGQDDLDALLWGSPKLPSSRKHRR